MSRVCIIDMITEIVRCFVVCTVSCQWRKREVKVAVKKKEREPQKLSNVFSFCTKEETKILIECLLKYGRYATSFVPFIESKSKL